MHEDPMLAVDNWGPEKTVVVSDRRTGMRGVLVIDNTARGVAKGGTRMSSTVTVAEISRLARTMTWKWAAVDLFHGGAKAGILGDPNSPGKERIIRSFARALADEVPKNYAFGLDMGLTEQDAAIFVDELGDRGASTGLPRSMGGLPYDQLGVTGYGVAETVGAASKQLDFDLHNATVAVQGFGAVGRAAAKRLHEMGATIVAVSTAIGCAHQPDGLDVPGLLAAAEVSGDGAIRDYATFTLDTDRLFTVPADVLIPAATSDAIDENIASTTAAKLIVEGANLPTTASARKVLSRRGIMVIPDFIANAGGIIAAAHSSDARYSPFTVEPEGVFSMIREKLRANAEHVVSQSLSMNVTPRQAASALAEKRVMEAMRARGFTSGHQA